MPAAAPRIDSRVVAAVALLDDRSLPIAEVNRRVGTIAFRLGLTKPSYEQVRVLVHALRRRRRGATADIALLSIRTAQRRRTLFARLFRRRGRLLEGNVTVCYLAGARSRKSARTSLKPGAA
jgi:hypothetical protein